MLEQSLGLQPFAGLWDLTAPRQRLIFCHQCERLPPCPGSPSSGRLRSAEGLA
jgi:hypothetical protein